MTTILIASLSITGVTCLAVALRPYLSFRICPICLGVSATWIWLVALWLFNWPINPVLPAILMGGSIVGLTDWRARRFDHSSRTLIWRAATIVFGFVAIALIFERSSYWVLGIVFFFSSFIWPAKLRVSSKEGLESVKALEQKLKDECCL